MLRRSNSDTKEGFFQFNNQASASGSVSFPHFLLSPVISVFLCS